MPTATATRGTAFYGTRISGHLSRTPEGFLVCHGARVCRSGYQDYRGAELGLATDDIVRVYRPPSEVTASAFIASLNGKPVCDGHPAAFVTSDSATWHTRGFVLNPRQGEVLDNGDVTIEADLVISDGALIAKVEAGLRELSCGYEYTLDEGPRGEFVMRNLRGNHVAVVPNGRAGSQVRILDAAPQESYEAMAAQYLGRDPKQVAAERVGNRRHALDGTSSNYEPRSWDEVAKEIQARMGEPQEDGVKKRKTMTDEERSAMLDRLLDTIEQILKRMEGSERPDAEDEDLTPEPHSKQAYDDAVEQRAAAFERAAGRYLGERVSVNNPLPPEEDSARARRTADRDCADDPEARFEAVARRAGERMRRGKK